MATYDYITATGLVVPDVSTLLDEVNAEFQAIFGDDFVVDPETPEGAWIAAEVSSRTSVARNNANLANQFNPDVAGGPFLDAIWALSGGERTVAARSTVQATVTGVVGTLIPSITSIAQTTSGDQFRLATSVIIPTGGSITASFESVAFGAIAAGTGTLTNIVNGPIGWETVNNTAPATLGRATETDAASRLRRQQTLALQGRSTAAAITSLINAVSGVRSLAFRENTQNSTQVIDGISLVAHSIWAAVAGGTDADVANALVEGKSAGANFNGAVSVPVTDPNSGQAVTVLFDRPTDRPILMRVTVSVTENIATNPVIAVREAVLAYVNGELSGEQGFVVGADVSPFELAGAISRQDPPIFTSLFEVAYDVVSPTYVTTTLPIALNELASTTAERIQVIVP